MRLIRSICGRILLHTAEEDNMYRIDKAGCPKGWAYVVDYMGNRCYYGPIADCKEFIKAMEGE